MENNNKVQVQPPRRRWMRRIATGLAAALGGSALAVAASADVAGATPWLNYVRSIQTNPFVGTTTKMGDNEGMAYVPVNNKLWVVDDAKAQLYSVDKDTGVLGQVIPRSEFMAATQLGVVPAVTAVNERTVDMEAVAYDESTDTMYVWSGKCCTSATLPTVYRLKRPNTSSNFTVESWQPLNTVGFNDMSGVGIRQGVIWTGDVKQLSQYDYPTNTFSNTTTISGVSAIYGIGFDAAGDMWVAGSGSKIVKYDWATKTPVNGFSFTMYAFGVNDARALEVIGNQIFVSDGYDFYAAGDTSAFGIRVFDLLDVTVSAPVASFTANKTGGLAPQTVAFTDTSTNIPTSWSWSFGDGTSSTVRNPSKTYSTPGVYNVTLTATNPGGSNTSVARAITITGASFTSNVASGTAPATINFTDTSTNSPTSWLWTFGDGTTSTVRNPSKQYATAGTYDVTLKATGAAGAHTTAPRQYIISAPTTPTAQFTKSVSSGAAPLSVQFTDTSTNFPTSWAWNFGDGGTSTQQNPSHSYATPGDYNVTLTATNATGSQTSAPQTISVIAAGTEVTSTFAVTEDAFIELATPTTARPTTTTLYNVKTATNEQRSYLKFPVTGLSGTVTSATLRLWTTDGTDNGSAWYRVANNSWTQAGLNWNNAPAIAGQTLVGDPAAVAVSTWNEIDVTAVVTGNGTFTFASLPTSANSERYSSKEGTTPPQLVVKTLAGGPPLPVASFTPSTTSGVAPLSVSFTDTTTNSPSSWSWSFGDGSAGSTQQNPTYTFAAPGTYDVTLTATNASGSNTSAARTITVTPPPSAPQASFTKSVSSGAAPLTVSFTDTSTNVPTSWVWSWGDGTANSTTQNASHTFSAAGSYDVTLTATNAFGSGTSAAQTVVVGTPAPVASFTKSVSSGAAPLTVSFTDTSTNTPTSWSWNFGDGTTSSQQNPSKTYSSAGSFNVTLTATNAGGSSTSAAQTITVTGGATSTTFTPSMDSYVSLGTPTTTRATATTLYNLKSATNEHRSFVKFAVSGVSGTVSSAKLRLWVTEGTVDGAPWYRLADDSWLDTTLVWNNAPSVAAGTLVGNPGVVPISTWLEIDVTAVVTGNGTFSFATLPTSSDSERFASKEATNKPQLVITTGGGGGGPVVPVASFTKSAASGVAPLAVNFTDTSTNAPTSWAWDFGDGTTSTSQNPSKTYSGAGTFNVTLTATNAAGSNTSAAQTVTVSAAPVVPVASFTKSSASGVAPLAVNFTDTSTNTPTSWSWDFGDGTTSTSQNPSKTYSGAGTFNVTLTATNAAGSNTSAAQTVTVSPGGGGGTTSTFIATDDSYIDSATPTTVRGTTSQMYNISPTQRSYLKFNVTGVTGTVTSAKLRLWVTDGTDNGAAWYRISDNAWNQSTLTWSNAPTLTGATLVGDPAAVAVGAWLEITVTATVTGNGTYSFANLPTSLNGEKYASKENSVPANAPQLVITTS